MLNRISNPYLRGALEWAFAIGIAVVFFIIMRNWVFRMAHVSGDSMEPTLSNGNMVILTRLPFLFSAPRSGDIVAFPNPANPSEFYIKRVIGIPGDIVDLRSGVFYLNDAPLQDDFSTNVIRDFARGDVFFPLIVEEGHFFVLGDNRSGSMDSRHRVVGNISSRDMVGRVLVRVWPLNVVGSV